MNHERIDLTDTAMSAMGKLSEGSPGALRILCDVFERAPKVDPDNAMGGLGVLLSLDTHAIYGAQIWMLYKDVCHEDLVRMIGVLRAVQLGITDEATLKNAIENRGNGLDVESVLKAVRERLPRFGRYDAVNEALASKTAEVM